MCNQRQSFDQEISNRKHTLLHAFLVHTIKSIRRWQLIPVIISVIVLSGCGPVGTGISNTQLAPNNSPAPSQNGLPSQSYKQTPQEITFHGCPPQGDGGDPVLNRNKNRVDDGSYQSTAFNTILKLGWPQDTERTDHSKWSPSSQAQIGLAEGLPVAVEGYLALARAEGPETPNCHSADDVDFHIWLIDHPGGQDDRVNAIVVESTPRVRANHSGWTTSILNKLASAGTKVRISGWLMFDPEHPDQVGKTRGTIWEIHPIMKIDVWSGNQWIALDSYKG